MTSNRSGFVSACGKLRRCVAVTAVAGFAAALLPGATPALAGACEHTTRVTTNDTGGRDAVAVSTTVRNKTKDKSYDIVIALDGEAVQSGTISPSGTATKISKLEKDIKGGEFGATVTPTGEESVVATCTYKISTKGIQEKFKNTTAWSLPSGAESPCSGSITVSCDKSFNKGSLRWNTTFTIGD